MLYRIKEAFWSWGDDFSITDREGNEVYRVDGAAFSWGDSLTLLDMRGRELARIKQRLLSFKPCYEISVGGQVFAEVRKEWSWFKQTFTLDVPGPNDYTVTGSFWRHAFTFERGGRVVATVSKAAWGWTDSYGVDIAEGEDDVAILCTCIVIDQVLHDGEDDD